MTTKVTKTHYLVIGLQDDCGGPVTGVRFILDPMDYETFYATLRTQAIGGVSTLLNTVNKFYNEDPARFMEEKE